MNSRNARIEKAYCYIIKALRISKETYENYKTTCFVAACSNYSNQYGLPLKNLITNAELYKWYDRNWEDLVELEFYEDYKEYLKLGIHSPQYYYAAFNTYPEAISYYPHTLLTMLKNQTKKRQDAAQ